MSTNSMALDVSRLGFTRRTWVPASVEDAYRLISDVSTIELWSPTASRVSYDDGDGPRRGAWFSGQNARDGRTWTTRSQVSEAVPGQSFGFVVGGLEVGIVEWRCTLTPAGAGCEVRQHWALRRYDSVLGQTPQELIDLRIYMIESVEQTLVSLARWFYESNRQ